MAESGGGLVIFARIPITIRDGAEPLGRCVMAVSRSLLVCALVISATLQTTVVRVAGLARWLEVASAVQRMRMIVQIKIFRAARTCAALVNILRC